MVSQRRKCITETHQRIYPVENILSMNQSTKIVGMTRLIPGITPLWKDIGYISISSCNIIKQIDFSWKLFWYLVRAQSGLTIVFQNCEIYFCLIQTQNLHGTLELDVWALDVKFCESILYGFAYVTFLVGSSFVKWRYYGDYIADIHIMVKQDKIHWILYFNVLFIWNNTSNNIIYCNCNYFLVSFLQDHRNWEAKTKIIEVLLKHFRDMIITFI